MRTSNGIDVSVWQGDINWAAVGADGIRFAMVRLGYGSADGRACRLDANFARNVEGALAAGLDVGVYFYSYAMSAEAAAREAAFVLAGLQPYAGRLAYPVAYDLENASQTALGKTVLTDMVEAFCSAVQAGGWYASYYTNLNWLRNYLDAARLTRYDLWLAQWASAPSAGLDPGMWQRSSTGHVSGISGNVDLDVAYKDYPAIIQAGGYNGYAPGEVIHLDMTQAELKAFIEQVINEQNPVYAQLSDVPAYWQAPAKALLETGAVNGGVSGDREGETLNLRRETLKAAVIAVRYCDVKTEETR